MGGARKDSIKIPKEDKMKQEKNKQKQEKAQKLVIPVKKAAPIKVGGRLSGPVADGGRKDKGTGKGKNVVGAKPKVYGNSNYKPKPTPKSKIMGSR